MSALSSSVPLDPGERRALEQIDDLLIALRDQGRRAVRILDLGCGAGGWLIRAVLRARMLGFAAIEGRGVDDEPCILERAHETAAHIHDPRIGLSFALGAPDLALADEEDHGVDLVLVHGHVPEAAELHRVAAGPVIQVGAIQ